jgi:hypothetical protein
LKQCVAIDVQVERMQKFEFIRHYAKWCWLWHV